MSQSDKQREFEVRAAITRLMEFFDSVQIVATWRENGETCARCDGDGNYYARRGSVQEWLERAQSEQAAKNIAAELADPPEDGEEWKCPTE